jgi:hypothetical protein
VNEIDPLFDDEPGQAAHVQRHRQRILGRGRKRRQHAADRLQLARQAAAFRGHQRARAGPRQGGGDVDGRAFGAARVEPRNDLQDRAARERGALGAAEGGEGLRAHALVRHRGRRRAAAGADAGALTSAARSAKPSAPEGATMRPAAATKRERTMGTIEA